MVGKGASAGHSEMRLMARLWKDSPGSLQWRPRLACPLECHKMVIRNGPHLLAWYILVGSVGKIRKQRESQEGGEPVVSSPQLLSQEQPFWLMLLTGAVTEQGCSWELWYEAGLKTPSQLLLPNSQKLQQSWSELGANWSQFTL